LQHWGVTDMTKTSTEWCAGAVHHKLHGYASRFNNSYSIQWHRAKFDPLENDTTQPIAKKFVTIHYIGDMQTGANVSQRLLRKWVKM